MEEKYAEYLLSLSKKLLFECGQTAEHHELKTVEDIVMVQLCARYLKDVGYLQYCYSLKICILSGNFISNIDALESCTHLIKLDLHSNQMEDLPGPVFWGNMKNLSLLYLHDNTISNLENVHSLSFCPNLIALTLFNTPLSLKIAYRHIVVNSIISLKSLDYYVISDEEIIESWRLPEKYKPFTLNFFVNICPLPGKETTFQEEMKMVREIISKINHILSHYSPILIIQKWVRGHLLRKRLCLVPLCEVLLQKPHIRAGKKEIYIQVTPSVCDSKRSMHHIIKPAQRSEVEKLTSGIQVSNVKDLKELHLYLKGLRQPVVSAVLRFEEKKRIKQKGSKRLPKTDLLDWKQIETNDEKEMASQFRLSVAKMPFYSKTVELQAYRKREKYNFDDVYNLHFLKKPLPEIKPMHDPGCIERRAFVRAYGSIRLRPLCAIDKAYWENQKLDILLRKEREVMQMQISQNAAKEYTCQLTDKRTDYLQRKYEQEKFVVHDFLKERQEDRATLIRKIRRKYVKFLESKEAKTVERTFIHGFSAQHTSLTKGLLRLDGWRSRQESIDKKRIIVQGVVEEHKQWKDIFKHLQEQRQSMLQFQGNAEKMFRKYVVDEKAKERSKQAKAKVATVKKPREKIMYSLPIIGSSVSALPIEEIDV
ncbi:PREDICTED: leucine-rich repeat and IQ domain-containing protein 3 [Gekko japonicus]|uniref:Leucine-rich repeat and IQ domain-containing protein 3 n=1 Tax=Gekko japonicus TaxID=146911 RepID=A0ABM1KLA8_GEKJA|nr:PREDICTED: leucine-rich repeat and IQ domain-containing protein 3 [Gekko japonicus]